MGDLPQAATGATRQSPSPKGLGPDGRVSPIALKPCPFCGGSNVSTFGPYGWYHQWGISHSCKSFYSGAQEMFQGFHGEAEAIEAWNTRHGEADAPNSSDPIARSVK